MLSNNSNHQQLGVLFLSTVENGQVKIKISGTSAWLQNVWGDYSENWQHKLVPECLLPCPALQMYWYNLCQGIHSLHANHFTRHHQMDK